ncbi:MAG TPA: head GIN domain-containing protein [Chitinophagaceae bacterium]|nr:head GIN domain-containing protein [Chitinophagaceae bacterium]
MKKILTPFFLFSLYTITVMAQEQATIEGSGNIITKDISVQPFEAIRAKGLYELILLQAAKESVQIEADDNLQYLFSVSNDGSTLIIDMPKLKDQNINFKNEKARLKVYVTFKKIKSLDIGVIGKVHSATPLKFDVLEIDSKNVGNINLQLSANKLTVSNKGVSNITLSGNATDAVVTNSGVGQFNSEDLVVQTMNINNSGVGHANVNVTKDLTIKESFLGRVSNKGNAKKHKMDGVVI